MTRPLTATIVTILALAVLAPAATAHGALEPREIDTRILVDDDGALGPATCADQVSQSCDARPKGLDLVTLDVREAYWVDPSGPVAVGTPVLALRLTVQENAGAADQVIEIHVTSSGQELTFGFASDANGNYTSDSCTGLFGPETPAGSDGDQQAFDCLVTYSALGANGTGAALSDIEVHSEVAGEEFDTMPGTWFLDGNKVPYVPSAEDPTGTESTEKGAYTLAGPAALLGATLSATSIRGSGQVTLSLENLLTGLEQVASLNMTVPATIQASLDAATAILGNTTGNKSRDVPLNIVGATADGNVTIVVTSDLGAYQVLTVNVQAPPKVATCPTGNGTYSGTSTLSDAMSTVGTACPPTSSSSSNASGAPEMVFGASLLLGLALVGRRRRNA